MDGNEIGAEGAKHIADALIENETLEEIWLNENKIGDDGAKSLANCFMVSHSIREIWLENNNISDDGGQKLIEALKWNYMASNTSTWKRILLVKMLRLRSKTCLRIPNGRCLMHKRSMYTRRLREKIEQ